MAIAPRKKQKKSINRPLLYVSISIGVLLLIICIFIPLDKHYFGFTKYAQKYLDCGHTPIKKSPAGYWSYSTTYLMPGKYVPGGINSKYYCTEKDAQLDGLKRDIY